MFNVRFHSCVVTCLVLIASSAWGVPMLPGTSAVAVTEPDPAGGAVVAAPLSTPMIGTSFNATVTSTVLAGDGTNPYGGLTFLYQIANSPDSIDAIGRFTVTGFNGWQTDMSFQPGLNLPPASMDRSFTGEGIGYRFLGPPLGPSALLPGSSSELLVVQTDAPAWTLTNGYLIDGSTASGAVYAPAPEPATLLLLAGGFALLRRRGRIAAETA